MSEGFEGVCAIVTGGSKGIGEATAKALLGAGAEVTIFDVDDEAGEALAAADEACHYAHVDVADKVAVEVAVAEVAARRGAIHMLVNNAGIAPPLTMADLAEDDWQRLLGINVMGPFNCTQAVVPHMKENGGAIVNVSSVAGKNISLGAGMHYTTSKWGVIGLSRHMAYELAPHGIRVNVVCPGPTLTPLIQGLMDEDTIKSSTTNVPLGRWVMAEDIANAIMFFLGPQAAMCAGAELIVDGGVLVGPGNAYDNYFESRGSKTPERKITYPE